MKTAHLAWLAFLLLALRLVVAFWVVPSWEDTNQIGQFPDAYPSLAQSMVNGDGFGFPQGANPTTVRGPGFPLWLAAGMLLGIQNAPLLAFWSTLPGALAALALAAFSGRIAGGRVGVLTGLGAGLFPLSVFTAARCMSDDFYAALGISAAILFWKSRSTIEGSSHWWPSWREGLAAVLLAFLILTRSIGILALAALLVPLRRPSGRDIARLVIIAALALLPAFVWSIRSSQLEKRPVFVHSLSGYNFWVGEAYYRYSASPTWRETRTKEIALVLGVVGRSGEAANFWYGKLTPTETAAMEKEWVQAAKCHILNHPFDYARRTVFGLFRFWFQAQTSDRTTQYIVLFTPPLLLALLGALSPGPLPRTIKFSALLIVFSHNLAYAMLLPVARMSVQVWPFLAPFIALGCLTAWGLVFKRGKSRKPMEPSDR